jgi:hypothetical protein
MQDYTIKDWCKKGRVCRQTAHNEIAAGRLEVYRIGRAVRITAEADESWQRAREAEASAASMFFQFLMVSGSYLNLKGEFQKASRRWSYIFCNRLWSQGYQSVLQLTAYD